MPPVRRLATLVAFIHCLESTAHNDGIEVLDMLLQEFFCDVVKADKKARLRSLNARMRCLIEALLAGLPC